MGGSWGTGVEDADEVFEAIWFIPSSSLVSSLPVVGNTPDCSLVDSAVLAAAVEVFSICNGSAIAGVVVVEAPDGSWVEGVNKGMIGGKFGESTRKPLRHEGCGNKDE